MLINIFKYLFIAAALFLFQLAVVPNLPPPLDNFNSMIVALIFICVVYKFYLGAMLGIILSFAFDLYSALPFGAVMISVSAMLYLTYKVFERVFTNKSFYSLVILTAIATLFYNAAIFCYSAILRFNATRDIELIKNSFFVSAENLIWQMLFNLSAVVVVFFIFHLFSRRFKAVFIDTTKN